MANETTIINKFGKLTGWNSVTVNLLGRDLEGITSLSYGGKTAKANAYGAGKYPIGRTEGNYEAEASLEVLKEETDALQLQLPAGRTLMDIDPFPIVVEYELPDGKIMTDIIQNVEFTNNNTEVKNGDGSISKKLDLICSHIDYNV